MPLAAGILLAAGVGVRFRGDKLGATIDGERVLVRSAGSLARAPVRLRIAVMSADTLHHAVIVRDMGFEVVENRQAALGISASIRCGVMAARDHGADVALIALADMPFVGVEHLTKVLRQASTSPAGLAFSLADGRRSPPAAFSRSWFERLCSLKGDQGARRIIEAASPADAVEAPLDVMRDIDTPSDLQNAR